MISCREEIILLRKQIKALSIQLRTEGHDIAEQVPLGAMIEVPAAAIALNSFIKEIDFLSIGTNDLVQYLLAADRNNAAISEIYSHSTLASWQYWLRSSSPHIHMPPLSPSAVKSLAIHITCPCFWH